MMRHVSVFRLKPECRTPEIIAQVEQALRDLPNRVLAITACEIGVKPAAMPAESPDGHVQFYDLIQIIDFATPEDCAAYPATEGHQTFLESTSQYMEQVIAIDYPV